MLRIGSLLRGGARLGFALVLGFPAMLAIVRAASGGIPVQIPAQLTVRGWKPVSLPGFGAPTALALDHAAQRIVVGGERGVFDAVIGGPAERVLRRGPVVDVAILPGGALLAATPAGLYRIDPDQSVSRVRIGSGEASNNVRRLAVAGGLIAAATRAGVRISRDARSWIRPVRLPLGDATLVALRERGDAVELWCSIAGQLWWARVGSGAPLAATGPAERVRVPGAALRDDAVDVAFGVPDAETLVVFPSLLLARERVDAAWTVLRPSLPPGAAATRLVHALDRYWLATDTGLLSASALQGPWRRAPAPAGRLAARALGGDAASLHVVTSQALLRAELAPVASAPARPHVLLPQEPDVAEVHRAALTYLSLQPEVIAELRRGVSRRGWLPILALRVGHDRADDRRRDYDQSYLSGDTRDLFDEQFDRDRELELALTLSWDFGDAAFHPEQIDVSREGREVIELRDDVLDEITQVYFERRRVLTQLAGLDPGNPERDSLHARAAELAAGLDAWTGGWFSRRSAALGTNASAVPSPRQMEKIR